MKNIILISILIMTIIVILYFIFCNIKIYTNSDEYKTNNLNNIDYIIVLGAQVKGDKTGSLTLINRLNKVVEYKDEINVPIIVSGGKGSDEPIPEADFMAQHLIDNGVDESLIIKENKATSTYENLKYSLEIINDKNANLLIVTTDFHVFRTSMLAKRFDLNFNIEPVKSKFSFKTAIREPLAVIKSFVFDR